MGHDEIVEILIDAKADVNLPGPGGITPLALAARRDRLETVKLLMLKKADVNLVDDDRKTALMHASSWCYDSNAAIVRILINNKSDVNHVDKDGRSPLIYTALSGKVSTARVLIEANANVDHGYQKIGFGKLKRETVLSRAVEHGHVDFVELLVFHGADTSAFLGKSALVDNSVEKVMKLRELSFFDFTSFAKTIPDNKDSTLLIEVVQETISNVKNMWRGN